MYAGIAASNAIMMGGVRTIKWDSNGWPVVMPERYGAVPQAAIKASELAALGKVSNSLMSMASSAPAPNLQLSRNGVMEGGSAWGNVNSAWTSILPPTH